MTRMSSTFTSEITAAATSHVLNTLSTLYANPPYAVLREFITNAIDAHRDAGHGGPVEVELPTRDNPRLVIRDHGKGMSRDTLVNTYYNYGESSKRGDSTSIGAFGFGSKSAYSVSPTWELRSVTAGSIIGVVSCINDDGIPEHTLEEVPNTSLSESGVTIVIPTGDIAPRTFHVEASRLLKWLPKGSVDVQNIPPVYSDVHGNDHWSSWTIRHGNLAFPMSFRTSDVQVVMVGVPYRANMDSVFSNVAEAFGAEHTAPITTVFGTIRAETITKALRDSACILVLDDPKALDVTTSRDDIKMTPRSLRVMTNALMCEVREALAFLTTSDGSISSLDTVKGVPLVGCLVFAMRSLRDLTSNPTSLRDYTSRKNTYRKEVVDFDVYSNMLWRKYPPASVLIITNYPETLPNIPLIDKVVVKEMGVPRDDIYITHGPDTGRAALDIGMEILSQRGVKLATWESISERAKQIRREERARNGTPAPDPVEGMVFSDHKVVRRFSVELSKLPEVLDEHKGVPLYFSSLFSDDNAVSSTLPRGFTGILIRSVMNNRRDNLLVNRYGVKSSAELSKLSATARDIERIRALSPKQRNAVLDYLDIESRNGVDYATVKTVYDYHMASDEPLKGTRFVKSVEACDVGKKIVYARDSGFSRYGMNIENVLTTLRKDEDRFYARYPLLTALNLGRATRHDGAMDAVVQYIKSVESV